MPPIGVMTGGVDFIIVALAILVAVKVMNGMKKAEEDAPKEDPSPSNEEVLLTEIRDLLKSKSIVGKEYIRLRRIYVHIQDAISGV